ncbi:MAG: hypothetical protein WCR52_04875 [Bacteroidota bacterium]
MFHFNYFKQACSSVLFIALFLGLCTQISAQEVVLDLPRMTQYLDGVQTTQDISKRSDITNVAVKDPANVYYFTSEIKFENWAQTVSNGITAINRIKALNNINSYAQSHGYLELSDDAALPEDMRQYMESQAPGISGPSAESLLYCKYFDDPNFSGASKFCPGNGWWTLGSFRNRAESASGTGAGIIIFCSKRWFGGKKMVIFMYGYFSVRDFGSMNNDIESHF